MSKFSTKRIATDAVFVAMYFVLAMYGSVNLSNNFRFSTDSLSVIMCALVFGPIDGMIVGGLGAFFYQLMTYGLSTTTVLWIIPAVLRGAVVGTVAALKKYRMKDWEVLTTVVVSALLVTAVNTALLYLDGIIWGYSVAVLATLPWRILCSVLVAIVYGVITPPVARRLRKEFGREDRVPSAKASSADALSSKPSEGTDADDAASEE